MHRLDDQYPLSESFAGLPVCPPIELPPQSRSKPRYGQMVRMAGTMAATATLSITLIDPSIDRAFNAYDQPPHLPGAVQTLPRYGQMQCDPVAEAAVGRTEALFDSPQNSRMKRLPLRQENAGESRPEYPKTDHELLDELVAKDQFFQTEAAKKGLTTVPAASYLAILERDQQNSYPILPFETYFTQAQAYMEQFGVTLRIANLLDLVQGIGYQKPTYYETVLAKQSMYNLIRAYSTLPKEYVALSNLDVIAIVSGGFTRGGTIAAAELSGHRADKTIFVNIEQSGGVTVQSYRHEQWHLVDEVLCGGKHATAKDPDFEALNEDEEYTDKPDYSNTLQLLEPRLRQLEEKAAQGEFDQAEQDQINADALTVLYYSAYAKTAVEEDKAELGGNIGGPDDTRKMLDDNSPKLRRKSIHQLARLWTYAPRIVEYFAATSYRV